MLNFTRILICLIFLGLSLYFYIDKINVQTRLRLKIPSIEKEIEILSQQNIQLCYQLENFNNPQHLLELAKQPEYSHLKFPFMEEVLVISSEIAKKYEPVSEIGVQQKMMSTRWPIYLGSNK